jgi:hypothetical protein
MVWVRIGRVSKDYGGYRNTFRIQVSAREGLQLQKRARGRIMMLYYGTPNGVDLCCPEVR